MGNKYTCGAVQDFTKRIECSRIWPRLFAEHNAMRLKFEQIYPTNRNRPTPIEWR